MRSRRMEHSGYQLLAAIVSIFVIGTLAAWQFSQASDGSGTNTVTPTTATAGMAGNLFTFTYTAAEAMNSGEMAVTVPAEWSTPGNVVGVPAYTTTTSSGVIARVVDTMDSTAGWSAGTGCANGIAVSSTQKMEGLGSLECITGDQSTNDRFYKNISSENWGGYTRIGFWIRSTVVIAAGRLRFGYDNNLNLASPIQSINFPAIPANTWTYVVLNFGGNVRTSVVSYGFIINHATNFDNMRLDIDDFLLGPGQATFVGNEVHVRFLQMAAGQTATVRYGFGNGLSGAVAPTTVGAYTFVTKSRISDAGTLTPIATSPVITVGAATATRFEIVDPTDGTVDAPVTVTVRALDPYGNVNTNYQNDVTLQTSGSSTGGGLVNIVNGVGTRSIADSVTENVHLILADTQATGLSVTSTQDVVFAPGATRRFSINHPSSTVAGTRAHYVIQRLDQFSNPVAARAQTVYLYSNSTDADKAFYTLSAGGSPVTSITIGSGSSTADVWYEDHVANAWTVTASDNPTAPDGAAGIADVTDSLTVIAASVSQFSLNHPGDLTAGERLAYVVTRRDAFGNLVSSGETAVYLTGNSPGTHAAFYGTATGTTPVTHVLLSNGNATTTFWYGDDLAGSVTITASDNATAPDGAVGITDATDGFIINPAATARFILNDPGSMTVGTRLGYTVSREDAFGNAVTAGSNTAYLYSNSVGLNRAFYNDASGGSPITFVTIPNAQSSAAFWYADDQTGSWTIRASDNALAPDGTVGIIDASDVVTVNPAPIVATRFVIEDSLSGTVGTPVSVTVKAEDDAGNIDTSYQSDVTLQASGSATGGGLVDVVDGVGTLPVSDTVAETVHLSLLDSEHVGLNVSSTQDVTFVPGPVAALLLSTAEGMVAGTRTSYVVSRTDAYGNAVTSTNTTAYLFSSVAAPTTAFYTDEVDMVPITSLTIPVGTSTGMFWFYEERAGLATITVTDRSTAPDGAAGLADASDDVMVLPGPTARLHLSDTGSMAVGTRLGYTLSREDFYSNAVTSSDQLVYLYSNSTGSNAFYESAVAGVPVSSVTIANGLSVKDFWYTDDAVGTWQISASDHAASPDGATGIDDAIDTVQVQSIPIVATRFVILPLADVMIGTPVTVTIQAQNNSGDIDTTYQQDVTLVTDGGATGAGLVDVVDGIGHAVITDGIAETIHLSLQDTQATGLNVGSVGQIVFSATPVTVSGGSAGGGISGGESAGIPIRSTPQGIRFVGTAYPGATVRLFVQNDQGEQPVSETRVTAADGSFSLFLKGPFTGTQKVGVIFEDKEGRSTPVQLLTLTQPSLVLVQKTILSVPTIGLESTRVSVGNDVTVSGFASPHTALELFVDGSKIQNATAGDDGSYQLVVPTYVLSVGSHTVRVRTLTDLGEVGGDSFERTFVVTALVLPEADLNGDGKTTIADWSIFLSLWNSSDDAKRRKIDMNHDGVVDLTDFSLFMRAIRTQL